MALQATVTEIDSVPEALRSAYVEKDGTYHLDVDGMVDKAKLDDFRSNNVKLLKDIETLQGKYKDVDVDQYAAFIKAQTDGSDKKLLMRVKLKSC